MPNQDNQSVANAAAVRRCVEQIRGGDTLDFDWLRDVGALTGVDPVLCAELVAAAFDRLFELADRADEALPAADSLVLAISALGPRFEPPIQPLYRTYMRFLPRIRAERLSSPASAAGPGPSCPHLAISAQLAWTIGRTGSGNARSRIFQASGDAPSSARTGIADLLDAVVHYEGLPPPLFSGRGLMSLRPPASGGPDDAFAGVRARPPAASTPAAAGQPDSIECTIWYGTNRLPVNVNDRSKGYCNTRDVRLHVGRCVVRVPKSRSFGTTGSSAWRRWLSGKDDRIWLSSVVALAPQRFWPDMRAALVRTGQELGRRDVLLYLHGYRTSFEEAAIRAAQLDVDLAVPGVTAFYSWPSRATLLGYLADAASVEASEDHIVEFVRSLCENTGAERIHLIAHSMGNRGLLRAFQSLAAILKADIGVPFGQVFLAAPDVDAETFARLAVAYPVLSQRTTMYVSSSDRAVWLSFFLHMFPRVGYAPPVTVVDGIDTVEVSKIDFSRLGHGAYAEAEPVLYDMGGLIRSDAAPSIRQRMQTMIGATGKMYWSLGS